MKTNAHPSVAVGVVALGLLTTLTPPVSADSLLVAGFGGDVVAEYDRATGASLGTFASHASMDGPTAMVYGTDGNLYVLNEFSHNVLRFNGTTGAFIDEFISSAALTTAGLGDPGDMEIGPDGHLYLSSHFSIAPAAVWKFNGISGAFISHFATFGAVSHTHGLAFGPGGKLYLGDLGASGVRQFDAATGADLGFFATHPSLFITGDLAFAPDGKLHVTSDGGNGVHRFTSSGAFIDSLIAPGAFQSYWGILFDGGSLYLGNKATGVVKEYTDTGVFVSDLIPLSPGPFDMIPKIVPEPSTAALLLIGFGCVATRRRERAGVTCHI